MKHWDILFPNYASKDLILNLVKTANTQPAILTASVACYEVLKEQGFTPDIVGGHSLR